MAPEQIRSEDVDHRADIFATGVVFYELLSGRKAFASLARVRLRSRRPRRSSPRLRRPHLLRDRPVARFHRQRLPTERKATIARARTFTAAGSAESFNDFAFTVGSLNVASGAFGLKANIAGSLLVTFNVLFRLNDAGVQTKVTPLVGLEYGF